jgi:hypothetical protein
MVPFLIGPLGLTSPMTGLRNELVLVDPEPDAWPQILAASGFLPRRHIVTTDGN